MATTREIQLRIKSVTGTQQITKAMKLVSTAKLQKIRGVQEANKPYFKSVYETMCSIIAASEDCVRFELPRFATLYFSFSMPRMTDL